MRLKQLRGDYDLLEAFEALGEWLYGDEWSGYEQRRERSHVTDPAEVIAKRAPFEAELKEVEDEQERLAQLKSTSVKEPEIGEYSAQIDALMNRRNELTKYLYWENPTPEKTNYKDWEEWKRREKTEEILISALAKGEIRAVSVSNMVIEKYSWAGEKGCRYYLDLSMVVMPQRMSSQKRHNVRIPQADFDKWLSSVTPINPIELRKLSPEDRCKIFLKQKSQDGPKLKSRDAYFKEARESIDGLAYKAFLRAWNESTQPHWRRPGRPRSK